MPWNDRTKRRLKLRDLDMLMAVIETGSMGKAAKRLNVTQPAVSKAIVGLEDALGVKLLIAAGAVSCRLPTGPRWRGAALRSSTTCARAFRRSISCPIRPREKSASERPTR
jgi:DNA-binding transcriptional LysR family regulator